MNLLIVESPNKARTLKKYLGKDWEVVATKGHILNLPEHELGIKIENDKIYAKWIFEKGKKKIIDKIKALKEKASEIYIATDDDREGEKIANDVVERAKLTRYKRITLLEITKSELLKKIKEPRKINKNIVNAAIARRLIDRYIGYPISSIISHDFKSKNLPYTPRGVGRVISPSLHILVELEKQIESFVPEEHYKVLIEYIKDGLIFRVTNPISFPKDRKKDLDDFLYVLSNNPHIVSYYKQKTEDKAPPKPLTTSTLQYGAWYLFRFKPKKTMKLAQELFEYGLITYHRTDSFRISQEAHKKMVKYLYEKYGEEYVVSKQREYKNASNAQDAHEAIRPTTFDDNHAPENILNTYDFLISEHKQLYEFIWYRTIITQMKNSVYDRSVVEVNIGGNLFKAQANYRIFEGWERFKGDLIKASIKADDDDWKDREIRLPEFIIGEELVPSRIETYDYTPHRPRRYGVGRFITTLSNNGIARPSTLDTIIENLEGKEYISINKGILYPQILGVKVDEWLEENVEWLIDLELAKQFEEQLDMVEHGKLDYEELIKEYIAYVRELEKRFKIDVLNNSPTSKQIEMLKRIENETGKKIPEEIYGDKNLATNFIKSYYDNKVIGKCPACKSKVLKDELKFYCSKRECDFVIWREYLAKKLEKLSLPTNFDFQDRFIKTLLQTKKLYFENIQGKNGLFNAYVKLEKKDRYWNLVYDFSSKPPSEKIKEATKSLFTIQEQLEQLKKERRLLKDAAIKDALTRTYNRRAFEEDIEKIAPVYHKTDVHVAFVDADKFKSVNDTYGHDIGDEVLKMIANKLYEVLKNNQIKFRVYRYGGEEFVIITRNVSKEKFLSVLNEIREKIKNNSIKTPKGDLKVTVSLGYAPPNVAKSIQDAVKFADKALYIAKNTGRDKVVEYKPF